MMSIGQKVIYPSMLVLALVFHNAEIWYIDVDEVP